MNKNDLQKVIESEKLTDDVKKVLLERVAVYPDELTEVHVSDILKYIEEVSQEEERTSRVLTDLVDDIEASIIKSDKIMLDGLNKFVETQEVLVKMATNS